MYLKLDNILLMQNMIHSDKLFNAFQNNLLSYFETVPSKKQ